MATAAKILSEFIEESMREDTMSLQKIITTAAKLLKSVINNIDPSNNYPGSDDIKNPNLHQWHICLIH